MIHESLVPGSRYAFIYVDGSGQTVFSICDSTDQQNKIPSILKNSNVANSDSRELVMQWLDASELQKKMNGFLLFQFKLVLIVSLLGLLWHHILETWWSLNSEVLWVFPDISWFFLLSGHISLSCYVSCILLLQERFDLVQWSDYKYPECTHFFVFMDK